MDVVMTVKEVSKKKCKNEKSVRMLIFLEPACHILLKPLRSDDSCTLSIIVYFSHSC